MSPSGSYDSTSFTWRTFVRRSGPAAAEWVDCYEVHLDLESLSSRALQFCHRRRLAEGLTTLHEMEQRLSEARVEASIQRVLERYLFGVLGYYHYRNEEWSEAEFNLNRAHAAVTAAVHIEPFLLPLAHACHEFLLHKARIARNRRDWSHMFLCIEKVAAMMAGDAPLCELPDGQEIRYQDLSGYFSSLPELTEAEQRELEPMMTPSGRKALLDSFVRRMLVLPGFAIAYP